MVTTACQTGVHPYFTYRLLRASPRGRPHQAAPRPDVGPRDPDEAMLEMLLTTTWMLATGRRLYQRPAMHRLSPEELIDFWADDNLATQKAARRRSGRS